MLAFRQWILPDKCLEQFLFMKKPFINANAH